MRAKWLVPGAVLLAALAVTSGCGEASWNPELKAAAPLDKGTPFVEALGRHGCPDAIQEIDSDTFTATWEQTKLVATTFSTTREGGSLAYLVRKGKVSGARLVEAREPVRTIGLGVFPVCAVILAWLAGRALGRPARVALLPLVVLGAVLVGTSGGEEKTGVVAAGGGVPEGSPVGTLLDELGAPGSVLRLPGEAGALLVYQVGEKKRAWIGGSDSLTRQAFLVQKGKVVRTSSKTTALQAQYYFAPFHESLSASGAATLAGWSAVFAALALALTTRAPRAARIESPPPTP